MSFKSIAILSGVLLAVPVLAMAEGDPQEGRRTAETCLGCHGIENYTNAYPDFPVPKLCGQNYQYVLDALAGYADGSRPHMTMHAHAATLDESGRQDVAAYFADLAICAKED